MIMKKKKQRDYQTYKWYLFLLILVSSFSILLTLFDFIAYIPDYILISLGIFFLIWAVFSLIMFFIFLIHKLEKIFLLLALIQPFDFVFTLILGMMALDSSSILFDLFGLVFPIITLFLSWRLILRK